MSLATNSAIAQGKQNEMTKQFGFEAFTGIQFSQLNSNLVSLNNLHMQQLGGGIGFIFSRDFWQAKIKPVGLYNSISNSQTAIKLIESSAQVNLYPIKLLLGKTNRLPSLYIAGGLARAKYKISGSYLPEGQTSTCIYDDASFSGSISSWNIIGGLGMEYQIQSDQEFISFFAEIKNGISAGTTTNMELFKNTSFTNFTSVHIGFKIGISQ